MVTRQ